MEFYVKFSFWLGIASLLIRIGTLAVRTWPHEKTETLGEYIAGTFLSLCFVIWAGIILFVR